MHEEKDELESNSPVKVKKKFVYLSRFEDYLRYSSTKFTDTDSRMQRAERSIIVIAILTAVSLLYLITHT